MLVFLYTLKNNFTGKSGGGSGVGAGAGYLSIAGRPTIWIIVG